MLDWIFTCIFVMIAFATLFMPERVDTGDERKERQEEDLRDLLEEYVHENINYGAFKNLSEKEFRMLPPELRQKVPDKCSFCRWMLECDPLEMALAKGEYCGGFEERRWKR